MAKSSEENPEHGIDEFLRELGALDSEPSDERFLQRLAELLESNRPSCGGRLQ